MRPPRRSTAPTTHGRETPPASSCSWERTSAAGDADGRDDEDADDEVDARASERAAATCWNRSGNAVAYASGVDVPGDAGAASAWLSMPLAGSGVSSDGTMVALATAPSMATVAVADGTAEAVGIGVSVGGVTGVGVAGAVAKNATSSMLTVAVAALLGAMTMRTRADAAFAGACTAPVVRKAYGPGPVRCRESLLESAEPLASSVAYQEMRRYASLTPPSGWTFAENSYHCDGATRTA